MTKVSSSTSVHAHNLMADSAERDARFGLRLSLPVNDTFGGILGAGWKKERWFVSEAARDDAIQELRTQHPYYRLGDKPTLEIEKINRQT